MSLRDTPVSSARRFDRGAWLTLAFVVGFAVFCAVTSALILRLPSDGCVMSDYTTGVTTPQIVDTCYGNWSTPLRHGDKILAFGTFQISNDVDINNQQLVVPSPPPGWNVGATIPYTVQRDNATITLPVPIGQLSWGDVARVFLYTAGPESNGVANWAQEYLLYLSAAVIFALAPRNAAARLLLVAFGSHFAVTKLGWGGSPVSSAVAFASGMLYNANFLSGGFWIWLYWPSLLLLVLSFPRRVWPVTRWPRAVPALMYGVPALVVLVTLVLGNTLFFIIVLLSQFALLFIALIAVTVHTFARVRDRVVRAQTAWLLLGLGCYIVPITLVYPFILFDPQLGDSIAQSAPALLLNIVTAFATPICFGIAITRYRLFDIEIIIRRTLVYSLLTIALGTMYLVIVVALQALFRQLTGETSTLAVVASTLVIAALFVPLRRRIQNLIDRRFYRKKYDAQQVLAAFALRAQQEADIDALAADLISVVQDTLEPEDVQLWIVRR